MSKSVRIVIAVFALVVIGAAALLLMPSVLPDRLAQQFEPPPATALPAPREEAADTTDELVPIPGVTDEPTITPVPPTETATMTATPPPTAAATATAEPTNTPTATPIPTATPLPVSLRLDGLENVPQAFNNCGPANVTIILNYHGFPLGQDAIAETLKPNPNDRNVSPWQVAELVNGGPIAAGGVDGLKAIVRSGGTDAMLKELIAAGIPPVIERGIDFNDGQGWFGHYLTLFGYDDTARTFDAMDTYAKPWQPNGAAFAYDDILGSWKDFNYTFFVIYPEAREAEVLAIVGEEDEVAMWENTVAMAREQVSADPSDKFAWFNLGTGLTELGVLTGEAAYYEEGSTAFDEARRLDLPYRMLWYQHRPYMAYYKIGRFQDVIDLANATLATTGGQNVEESYLWLGHAFTALNDPPQAGEAYRAALEVNSNFYPAQTALDWLTRDGG